MTKLIYFRHGHNDSQSWVFMQHNSNDFPNDIEDIADLNSFCFNDGVRTIDYILNWIRSKHEELSVNCSLRKAYRKTFEKNLMDIGLELETTIKQNDHEEHVFVKVYLS